MDGLGLHNHGAPPSASSDERHIFGSRPLFLRTNASKLASFSQDKWDLTVLVPQRHLPAPVLYFKSFPQCYQLCAKHFALALLQADPSIAEKAMAPTSIVTIMYASREFFIWLDKHEIRSLSSVTSADLKRYRDYLVEKTGDVKPKSSRALNLMYQYRSVMEDDSLNVDPRQVLKGRERPSPTLENVTPRIPESTLVPLIEWATLWVNEFAPDIIAAVAEYEHVRMQSPELRTGAAGHGGSVRLRRLLANYRRKGRRLPGTIGADGKVRVTYRHLASQAHCTMDVVQRICGSEVEDLAARNGIDPDMTLFTMPSAQIDGEPWIPGFPFWRTATFVQHLMSACYVLIAFYSGMRDAEIKHLQTGCLEVEERSPGLPRRARIRSIAFKGESRAGGTPAEWRVGLPAVRAVQVLEHLMPKGETYLFAKQRLQRNSRPQARSGTNETRTAAQTTRDINDFMSWVDEWSVRRSLVPPFAGTDKDWRITTKQFRRTLAWFIARRPGGSIAGAMQFRHLSIQMFEGYAGTSQAGFRVEVDAEQALVRGEQLLALTDDHAHDLLVGPAAKNGLGRLANFRDAMSFQGVVVDNPAQLQRLMEQNDPAIYIGELVTCVFDPEKALCLKGRATREGPTLSMCDPFRCANVAFTKANTVSWTDRIKELEDTLANGPKLAPHVEDMLIKDLADAKARVS